MLIEFTVGNFWSFKEPVTLSMLATKLKARDEFVNDNNTIAVDEKITLLTSAAVYGANASGKSNLIKALAFMRNFVLTSSKETQVNEKINIVPFRLNTETENQPSLFEIVFLLDHIVYRYGFEVNHDLVVSEWLFYSPRKQEVRLFVRRGNDISVSRDFKGGSVAKKLTRPNALFLSVAAQFNSEAAIRILNWFQMVGIISGLNDDEYSNYTARKFSKDEIYRNEIINLIKSSDVDIENIQTEEGEISRILPKEMPQDLKDFLLKQSKETDEFVSFKTSHTVRNQEGQAVTNTIFDLEEESEGTKKLFLISGPIIDSLLKGKIIIIDEIEARLHTHLTRKIVKLFNSKTTNPDHAQLIFATHDTNLLSKMLFRRDQIWFVEKDQLSASHLYSLAEIKLESGKIRNDASYEEDYLQGRYGAIPLLGELRQVFINNRPEEVE